MGKFVYCHFLYGCKIITPHNMKKLTFLLSFFWVFTSMAQFEMPAFNPLKGALVSSPNSLNSVAFNRESLKTSTTVAPVNYRLDWRYMITSRDLSNGQADSLAYYSNPLLILFAQCGIDAFCEQSGDLNRTRI